jgi:hypothetical protein
MVFYFSPRHSGEAIRDFLAWRAGAAPAGRRRRRAAARAGWHVVQRQGESWPEFWRAARNQAA